MYSKSDVLGGDSRMNTEKKNQTGTLFIPDIKGGVNPDFLERSSENWK
jgi:hypothetical protein